MKTGEILQQRLLPPLESEVLLARLLKQERTWILAHTERELTIEEERQWNEWLERRARGEPVAYIIERTEFYGRPFIVRRGALIPRPATEGLVSTALAWLGAPSDTTIPTDAGIVAMARSLRSIGNITTVVDCGTGSGCIAVTLALERPDLRVIATDISEAALSVARENAALHGVSDRIDVRIGSLLEPVTGLTEPFLLVANPPYVPGNRELPRDIKEFEPPEAVFAGPEGLDVLRPLVSQATAHPFCAGFVIECEDEQVPMIDRRR
ncbi:MAG: peptide chain release factor N(5)-glutamine methyltransferase [Candidatus Peribacteraceae bacterium]|nr:peptide chain release factor N(5)-glutamine methyltransferase [Candidatus Peribacteraceae bacterium]